MKNKVLKMVLSLVMGLTLVSMTSLSFADAPDLGDVMQKMAADLKAIAAQIDDSSKNQESAALADDFATVAESSKAFMADTIAAAAPDQQAAMKAQFDQMIDQTAALGTQLAAALRAGDTAQAKDLLNQLNAIKMAGHSKFR